DGGRIAKLKESTEMAIYTPGSTAGVPVSVLKSFAAPAKEFVEDADLYRERIQATVTGLLSLLGIDADPVTSRDHILLSKILDQNWSEGRDLDIANLIAAIQKPPFDRVGVMALDSFYPSGERFQLAMRLNNLLAAPGFEAWMQGDALNVAKLLHTDSGKPRISIMSIAHLAEAERMFFVAMLLNELVAWMRSQQGTTSLRAILYMDEIFGYMPPVANPPSKQMFLTLLKQARAYGLGLVLATQNPVDLDYKGLANAGTWFIGRLQTERDKARVLEGLEGAAAGFGKAFDRQRMEQTLAGLGNRIFLMNNVHEDEAVVFGTRWVMSYLAGPMTREQIKRLMADGQRAGAAETSAAATDSDIPPSPAATAGGKAPLLPPSIRQFYLPSGDTGLVYHPRLAAAAEIAFSSSRHGVEERRERFYAMEVDDNPVSLDWGNADRLPLPAEEMTGTPASNAAYAECPAAAATAADYTKWEKAFKKWLRENECIRLFKSEKFRLTSRAEESEGEFRARLQQAAAEERDAAFEKVRKRYAAKATTLESRLLRARQAIEREAGQSNKKMVDT
ncbi:MAG: ATP-binding protein, partial [Woeseiaceae bacterium]